MWLCKTLAILLILHHNVVRSKPNRQNYENTVQYLLLAGLKSKEIFLVPPSFLFYHLCHISTYSLSKVFPTKSNMSNIYAGFWLLSIFVKKAPSQIFDKVLYTSLIWLVLHWQGIPIGIKPKYDENFLQYLASYWLSHCTHFVKSVHIRSYSGLHFPAFGLNTERYEVSLRIKSECGKMRTRITSNIDTFTQLRLSCFKINGKYEQTWLPGNLRYRTLFLYNGSTHLLYKI